MEYLTLGHPPFQGLAPYQISKLFGNLPTPAYVIDQARLEQNGQVLSALAQRTGCHILLAQKAFSNYDFYPLLSQYLAGTEASGLYEARLGFEEMGGKEVHVFCAGYREDEFGELLRYADHIVFNSIHQLSTLGPRAKEAGKSVGLRINPQCSTQDGHAIYDPCAPGSRMGVTREVWNAQMDAHTLALLDGLHFHTLCEQNADDLATTLEAVALNAGYLVSRVVDLVENAGVHIAILDVSAACHMPDVLEMPYQPPILQAVAQPGGEHTYRLAGPTCLAGDVVGDYSFAQPLHRGDLVVFGDMAIYTTCKNNTFNGMPLPDLWRLDPQGGLEQLTQFGYHNFKARLGR